MKLSRRSFFRLLAAAPVAAKAIASTHAKPLPKPKPVVPSVDGAGQCGSSLKTNGWPVSVTVLSPGDVITIEAVNMVSPINYAPLEFERKLIVTGEVRSDSDGNAVIPFIPGIVPDRTSPFQNVSGAPRHGALVKPWPFPPAPHLDEVDRILDPNRMDLLFGKPLFATHKS